MSTATLDNPLFDVLAPPVAEPGAAAVSCVGALLVPARRSRPVPTIGQGS